MVAKTKVVFMGFGKGACQTGNRVATADRADVALPFTSVFYLALHLLLQFYRHLRANGSMKAAPKSENLAHLIRVVRGERVLLDFDLAALYGVETRSWNQAVKRNLHCFLKISWFQLSPVQGPGPLLRPQTHHKL